MKQQTWGEFWNSLDVREGIEHENMILFPLYHSLSSGVDYLTLAEAMETGAGRSFQVEEVSAGGSVNDVKVVNFLDRPVLILEGELLIGAKQNRTVHTTILIGGKSTEVIPVACVESGRWRQSRTGRFAVSDLFTHSSLRGDKLRQVAFFREMSRARPDAAGAPEGARAARSRRRTNWRHEYGVDQNAVWDAVSRYASASEKISATMNVEEVYSGVLEEESRATAFVYPEGCCGLAMAIGEELVGVDCFDRPATMEEMFPRLMKGYLLEAFHSFYSEKDAVGTSQGSGGRSMGALDGRELLRRYCRDHPGFEPPRSSRNRRVPGEASEVRKLFREVAESTVEVVPSLALGDDLRAQGRTWFAAALACEGRILHAELFTGRG